MPKKIFVTSPLMPSLDEFYFLLKNIWKNKVITNNGNYHKALEKALSIYLGVPYISLFSNGTFPLITALKALNITGEVITTPYSFVATAHSLIWNDIKPIFVDIDPNTCNIDPNKIEAAITQNTKAIMPVHVYGTPCNIEQIQNIANKYGLKVIYDAAHAFGVKVNGKSILEAGDISTISFHATKVYNTIEGGALICHDEAMKAQIDYFKNFGFKNETEVVSCGINCKMDEIRSAYGLLTLKEVDKAIKKRGKIAERYKINLSNIPGLTFLQAIPGVVQNYGCFPIFIDEENFGMTRDELYFKLRENNIYGRRYFFPLISNFDIYHNLPSASPKNLPNANLIAKQVICLPIHQDLKPLQIESIVRIIRK